MEFARYHPAINLLYFTAVLTGTILFRQPVFLCLSYVCAFLYLLKLRGLRALIPGLGLLPLALLYALWYGSYHHFGLTVLGVNFIGNQVTLESFLCGGTWAMVCVAAVLWMGCVHKCSPRIRSSIFWAGCPPICPCIYPSSCARFPG